MDGRWISALLPALMLYNKINSMSGVLHPCSPHGSDTLRCKEAPVFPCLFPQVALCCTQIWWTAEVGMAFSRMKEGYEKAMKEYHKKQVAQLNTLVTMLLGQLSKGDRQKIMTICTIDVHARDVVAKMIAQKVGAPGL